MVAPIEEGCARAHGLLRYTKMEKVHRRRLTVPPKLEMTEEDRQLVKNMQQTYRSENALMRQLKTAGLEGLSLLTSNALAVSLYFYSNCII